MNADTRSTLARCAALMALVAAGQAQASLIDAPLPLSVCGDECGPPGPPPPPPPPPTLPAGVSVSGQFFAFTSGSLVQGQLNDSGWFTFGGGAAHPYHNELLSFGDVDSRAALQVSLAPIAAVTSSAVQGAKHGRVESGSGLAYRVELTASDAAAADHISSLLGSSGAIANIRGSYSLSGSGYGYGSALVQTGAVATQTDPALAPSAYFSCGSYGTVLSANCAGTFSLALNFVSESGFRDGNPLSFVSLVYLTTEAQAGVAGIGSGYAGDMTAFLDPTITLAPGISASLVLGNGNNVSNLSPAAAAPEPSQMLLIAAGLLALGQTVRRRPRS